MPDVRSMCAIGLSGQLGLNGHLPWEGNKGREYKEDVENFFRVTRGHVLLAGPRTARAVPEYERQHMTVVELRSRMDAGGDAGEVRRTRRVHRRRPAGVGRLCEVHPPLGHHAPPVRRRGGSMVQSGLARR